MSDFYELNNYKNQGKLSISRKVFENITLLTAEKVSSAKRTRSGRIKGLFRLTKPVQVFLRKDGKVDIFLDISLEKGCDVAKVSENVQEEVASAISTMCEAVPFKVRIRVSSII